MPVHQYDPADANLPQPHTAPEQIHTVTTVTTDRTVEVPAPAQSWEGPLRTRKVDYGIAIW